MAKKAKKWLIISVVILLILLLLTVLNQTLFVDGDFGQDTAIKIATEAAIEKYPDFDYENSHVDALHSICSHRLAMWIPIYVEYRENFDVFFTNPGQTEYVRVEVHPYLTFIVKDIEYAEVQY